MSGKYSPHRNIQTIFGINPPQIRTKYQLLPVDGPNRRRLQYPYPGHWHSLYAVSSLLLKVLLLLAYCLLLLTAISLLFQSFFHLLPAANPGNGHSQNVDKMEQQLMGEFVEFQKNFSKVYKSEKERMARFRVFVKNMADLKERIELDEEGITEWGVTQFFDWTDQEMAKVIMSPKEASQYRPKMPTIQFHTSADYKRPKQWDWREKGVVTHVKNQLQCGSCWAFASVAVVETVHAIHNGTLVSLSEQQMIDCDLTQNGCDGGFRPNAFRYVRDNGLLPDSVYPYRGNVGKCQLPRGPIDPAQRVFVDDLKVLQSGEEQIADWISQTGPVSMGMNVTKGMYQYRGGIFSPSPDECAQASMGSHAMEVVGYGENEQGVPFWIMKNSWGSGYGVNGGYLHMRRGLNSCGLTREVYTALVNKKYW